MRKLVLMVAALVAIAATIETKPAQAYPWGWTPFNAAVCNIHRNVGKLFGAGDAAMENCMSAYYGN